MRSCSRERDTNGMLIYLHPDNPFDLYPDTCKVQIGAVFCQEGMTVGCFVCKMNKAQNLHLMTDKELLGVHWGL
eukprot:8005497-Ditylum_brightwellii.AAC.2